MSDYLPKAYIAIEDKRFYDHNGVDWKRTLGAIGNTLVRGGSSYGGSTITQQLVKNITGDKDSSGIAGIMRKVKRMGKSISSGENDIKTTDTRIIFKYSICWWSRYTWSGVRS